MTSKHCLLFISLFVILTILCKLVFTFFFDLLIKFAHKDEKITLNKKNNTTKIYFVIFFCYLIILAAFYPGLCNYDASVQIPQVIDNIYSGHHPLLHTLIIGHIYILGEKLGNVDLGILFYCITQSVLLAGAFTFLYKYISEKIKNPVFNIFILLFFAIYPAFSLMAISVVKDTVFTAIIIFASVLLLKTTEEKRKKDLIILCLLLVLMMLFRNNGILALFPVIIVLFCMKKYKQSCFLITSILIFLIFHYALNSLLQAQPINKDAYFSVISQQMARIYTLKDDNAKDIVRKYYDTEGFMEYRNGGYEYNPYLSDSANFFIKIKKDQVADLLKTSAKFLLEYPVTTIDSYLYLIQGGYYIFDNSTHRIYYYTEVPFGYGNINETFGITIKSKIPKIKDLYENLFKYDAYAKYPIFRLILSNALFVWILIFCFIGILSYRKKEYIPVFSFYIFLLISVLLGPCTCTRYYMPIIACTPLFITMLIKAIQEKHSA